MSANTTHPYTRNNFKGSPELQRDQAERITNRGNTKPLMTDIEFEALMLKRKELGLTSN